MRELPRVAAVVLNWRDRANTVECIKLLLQSTLIEFVVLVDNENKGHGWDIFQSETRIKLILEKENLGFGHGVNQGIEYCLLENVDQILIINNDARIWPEQLDILVSARSQQNIARAISPIVRNFDGTIQSSGGTVSKFARCTENKELIKRPDYLSWSCILVDAEVFRKLGLLDSRYFMYLEDVDFSIRAKKAGFDLLVCPETSAFHMANASHEKAGGRVDLYSLSSMIAFGVKWKDRYWLGWTLARAVVRAARMLTSRRHSFFEILSAVRIGLTCTDQAWRFFRVDANP